MCVILPGLITYLCIKTQCHVSYGVAFFFFFFFFFFFLGGGGWGVGQGDGGKNSVKAGITK